MAMKFFGEGKGWYRSFQWESIFITGSDNIFPRERLRVRGRDGKYMQQETFRWRGEMY